MADPRAIDGVLVKWGDRLFYPGNRLVYPPHEPRLRDRDIGERAALLRRRIQATVVRRAPQVMVKVTGGGRGMKAIAAHFRYISKNGRLVIEDDQGNASRGKEAIRELAQDWKFGGSLIPDESTRREAFNIMLSMPRGTDPAMVYRAAREFAQSEFADHKYVLVLHDHQAHPHVHLSVRAESKRGRRLHPRKADLHRWRETFAEKLRAWGIDAEASRQASRGVVRNYPSLWRKTAAAEGRERKPRPENKSGPKVEATRREADRAWIFIAQALMTSDDPTDRATAAAIQEQMQRRFAGHQVDHGAVIRRSGVDRSRT